MRDAAPARYWHRLDDGRVQCDLCPRFCQLKEGQRGFCFVRACENGELVLTTYGRSSGYCIDPIEKKPLNHFLPGTPVLSFGTAGCNLACKFCQNWDMSKSREMDSLMPIRGQSPGDDGCALPSDLGCRSIAFTYNDPVIFLEYAVDAAKLRVARKASIPLPSTAALHLSGSTGGVFPRTWMPPTWISKPLPSEFYKKICGSRPRAPVLDTLQYLSARDRRVVRD